MFTVESRVGDPNITHRSTADRVSIVLPTLNESENIVLLIQALLTAIPDTHEIMVVDDHSPDGTASLVRTFASQHPELPVKVLERMDHPGLTNSLVDGIRATTGNIVVWMDCDFSMPPETIPHLISSLKQGYDIAVGSRFVRGGSFKQNTEGTPDSPLAVFLSRAMNYSIQILLDHSFKDYTSGFIAIRREVLDQIPLRGNYGEYFIDLMFRALRHGYKAIEIPYICLPRQRGVSKTGQSLWQYLRLGKGYLIAALRLRLEAFGSTKTLPNGPMNIAIHTVRQESDYFILPMRHDHIPLVAGLHHSLFYQTLPSRLGIPFLEDAYGALLLSPESASWVMLSGTGNVVGFMTATRSLSKTFHHIRQTLLLRDKIIAFIHILTSWRDLKDYFEMMRLRLFALSRRDNCGFILSLGLHPDWQGKGFSQALMTEVDAFFAVHHQTTFHLDVQDHNPKGIAFCERHGFKLLTTLGRRKLYERTVRPRTMYP